MVTPARAAAVLERAAAGAGALAPRRVAQLLWAAPWLGVKPAPRWAPAVVRRLGGCVGELALADCCRALWAAARLQPDMHLPAGLTAALVHHTQWLLLAAAPPAGHGRSVAAGAAASAAASAATANPALQAAAPAPAAAPPASLPQAAPRARPLWPPERGAVAGGAPPPDSPAAASGDPPLAAVAFGIEPRFLEPPAAPLRLRPATPALQPPRRAPRVSPQDAVMLPWALAELGARPGAAWAAAFCGAAAPLLRSLTGLQLGTMLRALARMRAAPPPAFLDAAETVALARGASWEPAVAGLVGASVLQLRQLRAAAAAERAAERAAAAAGRAAAVAAASAASADRAAPPRGRRPQTAAAAAHQQQLRHQQQAAAEWELLASLGVAPLPGGALSAAEAGTVLRRRATAAGV